MLPRAALALAALLLLAASAAHAAAPTLRLFLADYVTDHSNGDLVYDYNSSLAVAAAFFLAVQHFNARLDTFAPVVGTLGSCNKNLSIAAYCDDGGFAPKAMYNMLDYTAEYDAIIGFAATSVALYASMQCQVLDKPVISHWSSGPALADSYLYPYFSRTGTNDADVGNTIAQLIAHLKYKKAALIYASETEPFKRVLATRLLGMGIELSAFSFTDYDNVTLDFALRSVADLSLNVIVFHGFFLDIQTLLPGLAESAGLLGNDKLYIFSDFDRPPFDSELAADPLLARLYNGSYRVSGDLDPSLYASSGRFSDFVNAWPSFETTAEPYMNSFLPPQGLANDAWSCRNSKLDFKAFPGFFKATQAGAFNVWAIAYDAVIAAGVAMCSNATGPIPTGSDLYQRIIATDFEGLSGRVRFTSDGNRDPGTFTFSVTNWWPDATGNITSVLTGVYDPNATTWVFSSPLHFKAGEGLSNAPLDVTPPPEDFQYLPNGLRILGYFEIAVVQFAVLVSALWMMRYRYTKIVAASQPKFLWLLLLGCALGAWAIMALTVDDVPDLGFNANAACLYGPGLYGAGFTLALASLLAKTYRVYTVFRATSLMRVGTSERKMLAVVAVIVACMLLLILVWFEVAPLVFVRVVTKSDVHGSPLVSQGSCTTSGIGAGFVGGAVALLSVLLFAVLLISSLVRNVPEEFQESRWIALAVTAILQIYLVGIPALVAVYQSVIGRFIVMSLMVAFTNLILLGFVFVPKMNYIRRGERRAVWASTAMSQADIPVEDGIKVPLVRERFKRFCEENVLVESYSFMLDVETWREKYEVADARWRLDTARRMCDMYMLEGALLEINVSYEAKTACAVAVRSALRSSEPAPITVFNDTVAEVYSLMNNGAWAAFVANGGLYGNFALPVRNGQSHRYPAGYNNNASSADQSRVHYNSAATGASSAPGVDISIIVGGGGGKL